MMFLSLYRGFSSADLEVFLASEPVREPLKRLFPTTSFFLISSPKEISSSLLPYAPIIFLVSMAPRKAIGFSLFLMSKLNCLHLVLFFSLPTSSTRSLDVWIFKNSTLLPQYNSMSLMYSYSLSSNPPYLMFLYPCLILNEEIYLVEPSLSW